MTEVMQCGLNRDMMTEKREILRACFENFDHDKVAEYGEADIQRIMDTPSMIRPRGKIEAVINNARCSRQIREGYGSFSDYIRSYSGGKTILCKKHADDRIPAGNGLSERISTDQKKRGIKYTGGITVYSHLQICGIINDHDSDCSCYKRINVSHPTAVKRRNKDMAPEKLVAGMTEILKQNVSAYKNGLYRAMAL